MPQNTGSLQKGIDTLSGKQKDSIVIELRSFTRQQPDKETSAVEGKHVLRGRLKIPTWSKNPSCALQLFRNSSAQSSEIRLITAIRTRILSGIQIWTIA